MKYGSWAKSIVSIASLRSRSRRSIALACQRLHVSARTCAAAAQHDTHRRAGGAAATGLAAKVAALHGGLQTAGGAQA
jgi:hypothetical protein